jgi:hypothetical protein
VFFEILAGDFHPYRFQEKDVKGAFSVPAGVEYSIGNRFITSLVLVAPFQTRELPRNTGHQSLFLDFGNDHQVFSE